MNGDKTRLVSHDAAPGASQKTDQSISEDNQTTIKSDARTQYNTQNKYDNAPTIINENNSREYNEALSNGKEKSKEDTLSEINGAKTSLLFGKEDIQKRLLEELDDIPELDQEDFEPEYLSHLIKSPFPNRTNDEQIRINRNFLRDAEPFRLERLHEDIKKAPEELTIGYHGLDQWLTIPARQLTLITGRPGHGKTAFMLNVMLNLARKYTSLHFLYYSYRESRSHIEIKLINMCGQQPFEIKPDSGSVTNFNRWKYEFKHQPLEVIREKAEKDPAYKGLNHFQKISSRIHIIDAGYHIMDLIDSVRSFQSTLPVGGVFIDYLQAIPPELEKINLPRSQQLQEMTYQLREIVLDTHFPVILGMQMNGYPPKSPEYDTLSLDYLTDIGDPELIAGLIIGLQNYSRSDYIGSNLVLFKSRFFGAPFEKAEKMPDTFKDKHAITVLLARVLSNHSGQQPDVELLYHKWLMRISDPKEE